jgi:hypothetical protein
MYEAEVYSFLKYSIIVGLILSFAALLVCSALVFDTAYIQKNPKNFLVETFLTGTLTAIPIAYLSYMRGASSYKLILRDSGVFFLKIVLIHLGFQLSGVYTVLFTNL